MNESQSSTLWKLVAVVLRAIVAVIAMIGISVLAWYGADYDSPHWTMGILVGAVVGGVVGAITELLVIRVLLAKPAIVAEKLVNVFAVGLAGAGCGALTSLVTESPVDSLGRKVVMLVSAVVVDTAALYIVTTGMGDSNRVSGIQRWSYRAAVGVLSGVALGIIGTLFGDSVDRTVFAVVVGAATGMIIGIVDVVGVWSTSE